MIDSAVREVTSRAELVDDAGATIADFPIVSGSVSFKGGSPENWAADLTLTDPSMVPTSSDHPLWPWVRSLVRIWHLVDGVPTLVCTVLPTKPHITDSGTLSISVTGRDVLADAARGGYGGTVLNVGGMTVPDALRAIFGAVAPTRTLLVGDSDVTLPAVFALGERSPQQDWTDVAALAGWTVRSDRWGRIVADDPPLPPTPLDWQEGPGCRVIQLQRDIDTDVTNRVVCRSTNAELIVPVAGIAEDDDEGSPTWVGRYGPYEDEITSDMAVTVAACEALARAELRRRLRPMEEIGVRVPQRADLDYLQPIQLLRTKSGVAGTYQVSDWRLPLGGPGPMEVGMVSRQVSV